MHSEVERDLKSLEAVKIIGADHVFGVMGQPPTRSKQPLWELWRKLTHYEDLENIKNNLLISFLEHLLIFKNMLPERDIIGTSR